MIDHKDFERNFDAVQLQTELMLHRIGDVGRVVTGIGQGLRLDVQMEIEFPADAGMVDYRYLGRRNDPTGDNLRNISSILSASNFIEACVNQ